MDKKLEKMLMQHLQDRSSNKKVTISEEMVSFWKHVTHCLRECVHYNAAVDQREDEIKRGWGLKGTMGYENIGCYQCEGYDPLCRIRQPTDIDKIGKDKMHCERYKTTLEHLRDTGKNLWEEK